MTTTTNNTIETANAISTENANEIRDEIAAAIGSHDDVLIRTGGYQSGFWSYVLHIDLSELKEGNTSAFSVSDQHDTAGTSFRVYHGVDAEATLPDGARLSSVIDYCVSLFERREELLAGFSTEWENGDEKAVWEGDDRLTGGNSASDFWGNLEQDLEDGINCATPYDLGDSENRSYVYDAIKADVETGINALEEKTPDAIKAIIEKVLEETYVNEDSSDYTYHGYEAAAEYIFEQISQDEDEE